MRQSKMKGAKSIVLGICAHLYLLAPSAQAHFGMLIPDENHLSQAKRATSVHLSFSHPFNGQGMDMEKPKQFYVDLDGQKQDLLPALQPQTIMDHQGWQSQYTFKRPGVYYFAMEPQPYWEPAEDVYIIHYTKTAVAAFGDDADWNRPLGLTTEIIPLLRPFGNYAGNTFVGQVLVNGQPVPQAEVEVEMYSEHKAPIAPSEYHETQVVLADKNGVFTFSCPQAGWWGFAALTTADYTMKGPDGSDKEVEQGAVFWIYFDQWSEQE